MIDRDQSDVSVVRQCELLDISRSSVYYSPVETSEHELKLMRLIDEQYMQTPFYGSSVSIQRLWLSRTLGG
jgi:putative transposase